MSFFPTVTFSMQKNRIAYCKEQYFFKGKKAVVKDIDEKTFHIVFGKNDIEHLKNPNFLPFLLVSAQPTLNATMKTCPKTSASLKRDLLEGIEWLNFEKHEFEPREMATLIALIVNFGKPRFHSKDQNRKQFCL